MKKWFNARCISFMLIAVMMLSIIPFPGTVHAAENAPINAVSGETITQHYTVNNNTGNIIFYKGRVEFTVNVPKTGTLDISFTIPAGGSINDTNYWLRAVDGVFTDECGLVDYTNSGGAKSFRYECKKAGSYTFELETLYQPSMVTYKEVDISVLLTSEETGGSGGEENPDVSEKFELVSATPVCGDYEVNRRSAVELTFSKEIMACDGNKVKLMKFHDTDLITNWHDPEKPLFVNEKDEEVPVSVKMYDKDKSMIQIVPDAPLEKNTIYYARIEKNALISLDGQYYGGSGNIIGERPEYYIKTSEDMDIDWGSVSFGGYTAKWDESLFADDPSASNYPGSSNWKKLAMKAGIISGLVYGGNSERALSAFEDVGLEDGKFYNETSELWQPGYAFAHKTIYCNDQPKELVVAVFRGTQIQNGLEDVFTDLTQIVGGVNAAAGVAYVKLTKYLAENDINMKDAIFLVTGHSLGGGMANCVAEYLSDEVADSHVFGFTYASPKTHPLRDTVATHKNISNFLSPNDWVVHVGYSFDASGHYGKVYYVRTPESVPLGKSHSLTSYLKEIETIDGTGEKLNGFWTAVIQCPVDVEVYDSTGTLVGRIVDNKVDTDQELPAYVDGDDKYIFLTDNDSYTVKLLGTDTGTMTYTVLKTDAKTEEVIESKQWKNVELFDGKTMVSEIGEDTSEIKLLIEGEDGIIGEIAQDGTETEVGGGTDEPIDKPGDGTDEPTDKPGGGTDKPTDKPGGGTDKPTDKPDNGADKNDSVQTGDAAQPILWSMTAMIALLGMVIVILCKKRTK